MVGCPWYLHVSRTRFGDTFMVKSYYNVHTYQRLWKNPYYTAQFVISQSHNTILLNPKTNSTFILSELDKMYSCRVDKQKVYRAKNIALQPSRADYESSYGVIRSYAHIILDIMPNPLAIVYVIRLHGSHPKTHFDICIFSSLALREHFKRGCRPFISINKCNLKGSYKEIFLSTVSINANIEIYHIVIGVYNVESTNTWT